MFQLHFVYKYAVIMCHLLANGDYCLHFKLPQSQQSEGKRLQNTGFKKNLIHCCKNYLVFVCLFLPKVIRVELQNIYFKIMRWPLSSPYGKDGISRNF